MDEDHFNQEAYCSTDDYHYSTRNHCLEVNSPPGKSHHEDRWLAPEVAGELDEFEHSMSVEDEQREIPEPESQGVKEQIKEPADDASPSELPEEQKLIHPDKLNSQAEPTDQPCGQPYLDAEDPPVIQATHANNSDFEQTQQAPQVQEEHASEPLTPQNRREQG